MPAEPASDAPALRRFENLIRARSGLNMREQETALLGKTLAARVQSGRFSSVAVYLDWLGSDAKGVEKEWSDLFVLLTNQESYFFRDPGQLSVIRDQILPALIQSSAQTRALRIWSAGCSTGEEAYSLAMMLEDALPAREAWRVLILGTDISAAALERARSGIYSAWSFRGLDAGLRDRFFIARGGKWEVGPQLRRDVTFKPGNLLLDTFPSRQSEMHDMDLIVCRNVFIYFGREAVSNVLLKFSASLKPGGYLVTGHAELHDVALGELQARTYPQSVVYRREATPRQKPIPAPIPNPIPKPISAISRPPIAPPAPKIAPKTAPLPGPNASPSDAARVLQEATTLIQTGRHPAATQVLAALLVREPRHLGALCLAAQAQDETVSHIPVLINTASEGRSAEFWSLHTGADGFLLKGVAPEELLDAIARVIGPAKPPQATPQSVPLSPRETLGPETILSKVCALVDQELYATTVKSMEFQTMLANLTEGILTVDTAGRISSANHFLCALLGQSAAQLQGRDCAAALGETLGHATRHLIEAALENDETTAREDEITGQNGQITPVAISAVPVKDYLGEIVGAICVFQDITRRREVEALNRLKNDLTDMIVHDLRTPLTSLLTGMESVEMLGEMNADQSELMNISIEGGQILLGMINDLLDISKMEDGSMKIERKSVEIGDLMGRALRQVTALATAKGLKLISDNGTGILALHIDEDKLLRTLVNLLSNAIKFTPAGGTITLATRFDPRPDRRPDRRDAVIFSCQDTGEGIPADAFAKIFEKFGQVESRQSGRMMSTGLGLTFCKMAVQAHQGRIWVQSTLGHGSNFLFAIPALCYFAGENAESSPQIVGR